MNVTPRLTQRAMSTVALMTIVGMPLPILKSILAKAVIFLIGVPVIRFGAKIQGPAWLSCA